MQRVHVTAHRGCREPPRPPRAFRPSIAGCGSRPVPSRSPVPQSIFLEKRPGLLPLESCSRGPLPLWSGDRCCSNIRLLCLWGAAGEAGSVLGPRREVSVFGYTEDPTYDVMHRPWPLPEGPWLMAQRWTDLLFAHWPVETAALRRVVPSNLSLDLHDGTGWLTIASFYLSRLRGHLLPPVPYLSAFPELNVRTYVTLGGKPGVYFFSLDAGSALAVAAARATFHLPYFNARMTVSRALDGSIRYVSKRTDARGRPAEFSASYRPAGPVTLSAPGTLDHWLSERYCLYSVDRAMRVFRGEIHHHQWPLQPSEAQIDMNTMATAAGFDLPATAPRVAFSSLLDVVVWPPRLA